MKITFYKQSLYHPKITYENLTGSFHYLMLLITHIDKMCNFDLPKIAYDNLRSRKLFTKENSCVKFLNDFVFLSKSVRLSNLLFQNFI